MAVSRRQWITRALELAGLSVTPASILRAADLAFSSTPFTLGVAAGFPETAALVLWTRLAPEPLAPGGGMPDVAVPVKWEVAEDPAFGTITRSGIVHATPDFAHSIHVEVAGLDPGRPYWYRFESGGQRSDTGVARTAPAAEPAAMRIAVANCQHYESGHYAAYGAIAREEFDLVLHVGDYIYENRGVQNRVRAHDMPACVTLDDYRRRYALYKSDPLLQAAHRSAAWMVTWDDHEVDNNYAGAHSERNDAPEWFLARRAAAYRAYYEHMPLPRLMAPLGPFQRLYTDRRFGGLVDVLMLDGRQYRSPQVCGSGLVTPCPDLFDADLTMLGAAQEQWLATRLTRSEARWKLLAQQTIFAQLDEAPGPEIGYFNDAWSGYPAARGRLLGLLSERPIRNPVILSGDVHAFLANDVRAKDDEPDSPIVATELVTSSISSPGPPQPLLDSWHEENDCVHLARSDVRGYTRLTVGRDGMRADYVAVDDPGRADSGTHVLASYDLADGSPGIRS